MNFSVTDLLVGLYRFLVSSHTVSLTLTLLSPPHRLPIPKLEDTMRRYLSAQKPLLDDSQFR